MDDVIILFGGTSSERRVSVASAQNVAALLPTAHLWFWAPAGTVHLVERRRLASFERPFETDFDPASPAAYPSVTAALDAAAASQGASAANASASPAGPSIFFLALHGVGGEDGLLQGWLEERRLPFTGSGAAASRRAFDKTVAKTLVKAAGVRTAEAQVVSGARIEEASRAITELASRHRRLVVKPVADGSSAGLCFIDCSEEASLAAALAHVRAAPAVDFLVEAFISGTELTVVVIEAPTGLRALPCSEIRVERGRAFDYAGKYLGHGTHEITPAEVPPEVHAKAGETAMTAHRALGCRGYSRTDIIMTALGPVYLETNNLPGLTKASFVPQQLAAAGISMRDFLLQQIALAKTGPQEPR